MNDPVDRPPVRDERILARFRSREMLNRWYELQRQKKEERSPDGE